MSTGSPLGERRWRSGPPLPLETAEKHGGEGIVVS
jgi:hypothetical protein